LIKILRKPGWLLAAIALIGMIGGAAFLRLSQSDPLTASELPAHVADIENGHILYTIGGCISCHRPPKEDTARQADLPSGGKPLATPLGPLYPPNITPDPVTGIGRWSKLDFVNAVYLGISPQGIHYIPAFPYTSYHRMPLADILDLQAYMAALPGVSAPDRENRLPLDVLLRKGVGLWKRLAMPRSAFRPDPSRSDTWNRGAYLVNGPGHCGECHTPRNILMIPDEKRHLAGGPHPEGKDRVPSLRNLISRGRYADAEELTSAMLFGETMGFDRLSSGGMGDVQANLAKLPEDHVRAIAEYLVSLK
jgi:mono/diheme cytochrome c family protein